MGLIYSTYYLLILARLETCLCLLLQIVDNKINSKEYNVDVTLKLDFPRAVPRRRYISI